MRQLVTHIFFECNELVQLNGKTVRSNNNKYNEKETQNKNTLKTQKQILRRK